MKKIILNMCLILLVVNVSYAQEEKVKAEKKSVDQTLEYKFKNLSYLPDSIGKPKIFVDGKVFNFDISLINQDHIESLSVLKGEKALLDYNAPEGVILIKTRGSQNNSDFEFGIRSKIAKINEKLDPLFIIDGEVSDQNRLKELSPEDIESISVLKDEAAKKLYGGENGVVIIKTKKAKIKKT